MTLPCFTRPSRAGFAVALLVALAGCGAASGLTDPTDGGDVVTRVDVPRTDMVLPPLDVPVSHACMSNADCAAGTTCAGSGGCGTPGMCVPPHGCPAGPPVCGCDGLTYPNACGAYFQGARVAHDGPCETLPDVTPPRDVIEGTCFSSVDCGRADYCEMPSCGGLGTCVPRPLGCPHDVPPVCGCDGVTFESTCFAHLAGVSVAFVGPCDPGFDGGVDVLPPPSDTVLAPCRRNRDCAPSEFCETTSCGGIGECTPRMGPCGPGTICGCDGVTYPNECIAFANGVSIAHAGRCGGITDGGPPPMDSGPGGCLSNADCSSSELCQGASCFGRGVCVSRTIPCGGGPVCGCNGTTYSAACNAFAVGERIEALGPCAGADGGGPTDVTFPRDVVLPDVVRTDVTLPDVSAGDCFSNADCALDTFCYAAGCGTVGRCVAEPPMCPPFVAPVCGCDGVTYSNFCLAFQNGERFAHTGACDSTGGGGGSDEGFGLDGF